MRRKKIVIVGGGFGGIRAALDLAKLNPPHTRIILISDRRNFEYHAALYRVVTGHSPFEACIPLADIFRHTKVELVEDRITAVDIHDRKLTGNSDFRYEYDFLVLALGSETAYFNIPGLKELSFGFKSMSEALALKRHVHEVLTTCESGTTEEKVCAAHFVVVGGGASGTELAGELGHYAKKIAVTHKLDTSMITVDLIEAAARLVPSMPESFSRRVEARLRELGVNIFLNRSVIEEEIETIHLKDMQLKAKTFIWTAGIKAHNLLGKIDGLVLDKKGRVVVDAYLRAQGHSNVFVIGDGAATPYSGMAQTALWDARFVAKRIFEACRGNTNSKINYIPRKPWYVIPIGHRWAAALIGQMHFYGRIGWWLRRLADFFVFMSFLSLASTLRIFSDIGKSSETCPFCVPNQTH